MEDDLRKNKKWKTTSKKRGKKEDNFKNSKNKKIKTTSKKKPTNIFFDSS